ncbi:palmitoyltransferase ZDHHC3 isoform X2 [Onthophagus taurus]|uniref:palmitoyltransferase ZDHHC3 isoform X2 n=1 Tax=Onthophagus taurus TaxID=166361 RepID=UPI000C20EC72|nr:palmitoyltransferase ZDHHC3 isoform X2 [Onthophagus taurus]
MFIKDPCGITCIIITYAAVFYADYVVIKWIVLHTMEGSLWGTLNAVAFNLIIFLLTMSHFKAVISDPGTVPLPQNRLDFSDMHSAESGLDLDWTICTRCETYRPPRAHHCRICKRCIRRMDHHCPWINNCVGERNQKYFIQFLVYVGILSVYAISLIVISWVNDCDNCDVDVLMKQRRIMHSIILLLESALFGLFVFAILTDQLQAILSDETAIEQAQKQGPYRPHKPKMVLLSEVCGRQHPAMWILPCSKLPRKLDLPLIDHDV